MEININLDPPEGIHLSDLEEGNVFVFPGDTQIINIYAGAINHKYWWFSGGSCDSCFVKSFSGNNYFVRRLKITRIDVELDKVEIV